MAVTPHYDLGLFTPLGVGWREDATAGALLDADMMLIDAALYELSQSGGSVTSVNGQTGVVVLTAAEVGADAARCGRDGTVHMLRLSLPNAVATETSRAESAEALLAPICVPCIHRDAFTSYRGDRCHAVTAELIATKVATTAYADAAIAAAKAAGVTVNAQGSSVSCYTAVLGDATISSP